MLNMYMNNYIVYSQLSVQVFFWLCVAEVLCVLYVCNIQYMLLPHELKKQINRNKKIMR